MPPDRAITLQDIADRVGVTRSTVSYAITGRGRVSDSTRQKVLKTADELGYRPNALARRLRGSRTGVVALRLPRRTTAMSYYMEATFGAAEAAEEAGLSLSLLTSGVGRDDLANLHPDGVILLDPDADDASARALLEGAPPVVTGEESPPGLPEGRGVVASDHLAAAHALFEHLFEQGARRPALVVPDIRTHWVLTARSAFEDWWRLRGAVPRLTAIPHPSTAEEVRAGVSRLLSGDDAADAIIAGSDGIVLNIITGAEQAGRRVGEDLLVATLVDSDVLTLTHPSVTAIDLHPREFGRRCVRLLTGILDGDEEGRGADGPVRRTVPIELRLRESTLGVGAIGI